MTASNTVFDRWTQPSYERRVRVDTYLWGSAGITNPMTFDKPPNLHIRNDAFGQPVLLSTKASASAAPTVLGTLLPGECFSIQVQNFTGILASCTAEPFESTVACIIRD
jgi:hypothetical protein